MGTTDLQSWNSPDNTTSPKTLGARILALANLIEKQVILLFASATARNAAIATPIRGMFAWIDSPGVHTWWTGTAWKPYLHNATQDVPGTFYSGGSILPNNASTVYDRDIVIGGPCVIEVDVSVILTVADGVTAAGQLGIRIGGINVRNVRYHNYASTRYMTATGTGVANVPAAATINVQVDISVDGTANGAVQVRDVNFAVRERSPR